MQIVCYGRQREGLKIPRHMQRCTKYRSIENALPVIRLIPETIRVSVPRQVPPRRAATVEIRTIGGTGRTNEYSAPR